MNDGCIALQSGAPGCPPTDSAGTEYTEISGSLEFGFQGAGRYVWYHFYRSVDSRGDSTRASAGEVGSYRWNGTTLTMTPDDSVRYGAATGTLQGYGDLTLQRKNFDYRCIRLIDLPGQIIRHPGNGVEPSP